MIEYRFLRPDGSISWIEGCAAALRNEQGEIIGWVGTCLDMTSRRTAEEAVIAAAERFRAAFDNAPIGMGLVTPEGRWLQVNAAFCRLLGYSEEALLGFNLADLTVPGDMTVQVDEAEEARSETRYLRADGAAVWVAASTTLVRGAEREPLYYVVQIEDIGDRKQTENELRLLADHDSLTGLLNRRGFMEGLRRELHRMERNGEYGALLLLDLDNFKLVNDTAGHPAGDQVLRSTADVLRGRLRATDIIGRLGGDEFAALVLNVTAATGPRDRRPRRPRPSGHRPSPAATTLEVTASIGVVAIDGTQRRERGRSARSRRPVDVSRQEPQARNRLCEACRSRSCRRRGTPPRSCWQQRWWHCFASARRSSASGGAAASITPAGTEPRCSPPAWR